MAWALGVVGGIAVLGALLLIPLALRLWRQLKAFKALLARASTDLADATAALDSAQLRATSGNARQ